MPFVADLLGSGSPVPFTLLAGPAAGAELTSVTAVDSLQALERVSSGALTVITGRYHAHTADYRTDIAIRTAAERGVPALVLIGASELPATAVRLAERAGLAVLSVPEDVDVATVVLQLGQVVRGDAADVIARAEAALAVLRAPGESPADLVARVSDALGRTVALAEESADAVGSAEGAPVWVAGRRRGYVVGPADGAVRLLLPAVAAAVSVQRTRALEQETATGQTRAEVIAELITTERAQVGQLAERARVLGFAVEDLHTVVRAVAPTAATAATADLAEHRRLADTLTLHVLQSRYPTAESWNLARTATDILLVATTRVQPRESRVREVIAAMSAVIAAEHPSARLHFGIGTTQRGIDGLRQSALEAGAAAAAAARALAPVQVFDATGLSRMLAVIADSPLSRRAVDDLLAPVDALGPAAAAETVATLAAYLDARGSLKAAATRLRLHPNTVGYRIRRITERLGFDLDDVDTAFALQLACRVRQHN